METGKTSKYFKYAIGEIILVVIGILIALQINNWNESRKEKQKEIALLKELRINLEDTKKAIDTSLIYNQEHIGRNNYLIDIIKTNDAYHPKLDTIFGYFPYWATPYLTQNAYQNIKTIGVEIISDSDLRKHIVELHEETLPKLLNDWDRWEWDINQTIVMPFFSKHIQGSMTDRFIAKPNDFEALKTNDEFLNILSIIYRTRIYGIGLMEESLIKIKEVQGEIDKILAND